MADNIFNPPPAAPPLPSNLMPVRPHLARHGEYLPEVGGHITIDLGGEISRCTVVEVLGPDAIVVVVGTFNAQTQKYEGVVLDKSNHGYKVGSNVGCLRAVNDLGAEEWRPINERQLAEQEAIERFRQGRGAPAPDEPVQQRETVVMPAPALAPHPSSFRQVEAITPISHTEGRGYTTTDVVVATSEFDVPHETSDEPARKVLGPRRTKVSRRLVGSK